MTRFSSRRPLSGEDMAGLYDKAVQMMETKGETEVVAELREATRVFALHVDEILKEELCSHKAAGGERYESADEVRKKFPLSPGGVEVLMQRIVLMVEEARRRVSKRRVLGILAHVPPEGGVNSGKDID